MNFQFFFFNYGNLRNTRGLINYSMVPERTCMSESESGHGPVRRPVQIYVTLHTLITFNYVGTVVSQPVVKRASAVSDPKIETLVTSASEHITSRKTKT